MSSPGWKYVLLFLLAIVAILVTAGIRDARLGAHASAKSALLQEISTQLDNWPVGHDDPSSLSELRLTYPDGGDASLLSEFEYSTSSNHCSVGTTIWRDYVVKEFPNHEFENSGR